MFSTGSRYLKCKNHIAVKSSHARRMTMRNCRKHTKWIRLQRNSINIALWGKINNFVVWIILTRALLKLNFRTVDCFGKRRPIYIQYYKCLLFHEKFHLCRSTMQNREIPKCILSKLSMYKYKYLSLETHSDECKTFCLQ